MLTPRLSRTFLWNGRRVKWDRFGSGPPVVLLHGTPWSSGLWRPIADKLSHHVTVYLWDMPGYGESSKDPSHPVDLGTQGEVFTALLEHWGLTRPHIIAHDFGGAVALRARIVHGIRFASLCLVDVVALSPWGSPFFTLVKNHADVFAQLPAAIHRGALEAYIRGASHSGLSDDQLGALVDPWLGEVGQQAFYRQIAQADERYTDDIEPAYGTLTEPVHIVWATDDTWIPVDRAERLHALIPHSTLTRIPGAGHLVQLDAEDVLADELVDWLARTAI